MDDVCVSRQGTSDSGSAPVDREVSMHTTVALRSGNDVRTGSGRPSADSHLLFRAAMAGVTACDEPMSRTSVVEQPINSPSCRAVTN